MSKKVTLTSSTIVVTGSSGLIGRHLVRRLRLAGYDVIEIDTRHPEPAARVDIRDTSQLASIVHNASGVVHLAAVARVGHGEEDPALCNEVNVGATTRLVNQMAVTDGAPWLIHASSREVYGQQDRFPVREDAPFKPMNVYAHSKVAAEHAVSAACARGLRAAVVRFSNVYGDVLDYSDRVIPAFCAAAARGGTLRVDGENTGCDFTHVRDVADGVAKLIRLMQQGGPAIPPLNFASGRIVTLGELAKLVISRVRPGCKMELSRSKHFSVSTFCGDPTRARELLSWSCATPLEPGHRRLSERFRGDHGRSLMRDRRCDI
jgi:nucleoside-diphosphate-sugar epimerase